jgi:acetyltransferase-like isoleucine patch superfamily enzyme
MIYFLLEILRRVVTIIATSFLFELPGLKLLRNIIMRFFFPAGENTHFKMGAKLVIIHPNPNVSQKIVIGSHCEIGVDSMLDYSGSIFVGNDVWISQNVKVFTHTHPVSGTALKRLNTLTYHPLTIEDDAWLGAGSIILPSVGRIGKGAIIGAGAVVTKPVNDYDVVAGNPAKKIGNRLDGQESLSGVGAG